MEPKVVMQETTNTLIPVAEAGLPVVKQAAIPDPTPAAASATVTVTGPSIDLRVAKRISLILHPFLIAPLSIVLVLYLDTGNLLSALGWAGLCAAFVVAPAGLYLRKKLKKKAYSDADVSVRKQRYGFYVFGTSCMVVCFAVLLWMGAPQVLVAFFGAALLSVVSAAVLTRFWTKVSIHAGVMAGATVAVVFYSLAWGGVLAGLTLLVSWSRLVLKRHTLQQAILGWMVAVVCVAGVFLVLL